MIEPTTPISQTAHAKPSREREREGMTTQTDEDQSRTS
ncbi:unnamed protein product [Musa textilis]